MSFGNFISNAEFVGVGWNGFRFRQVWLYILLKTFGEHLFHLQIVFIFVHLSLCNCSLLVLFILHIISNFQNTANNTLGKYSLPLLIVMTFQALAYFSKS